MNRSAFFGYLRKRDSGLFGTSLSQGQVDGIEALLTAGAGLPVHHMANVLAQVYHETGGGMYPIKETVMPSHKNKNPTDAEVIARLDRAFAKGQLSWVKTPYWRNGAFGRGQIQCTHDYNYVKFGITNYADALKLDVSARIAVEGMRDGKFTGKKLADYDFPAALDAAPNSNPRRIVNGRDGTDAKVAGYHRAFAMALVIGGWRDQQPREVYPAPTPPQPAPAAPAPAQRPASPIAALIAAILRAILSIFTKRTDTRKAGLVPVPHQGRTIYVTPDYYAEDGIRMPVDYPRAVQIAAARSMELPTREMVDSIYRAADVKLTAQPIPPSSAMTTLSVFRDHDAMIERQLNGRTGLIAGHKKDILRDPTPGRVRIYGWNKADGTVWQPVSEAHGETYRDYSHGLRLVYDPDRP